MDHRKARPRRLSAMRRADVPLRGALRCPVSGKVVHFDRRVAEAQLRSLQEGFGYAGHVYPCEGCGGFHVGREKRRAHRNRYAHLRGRQKDGG